MQSPTLERLVKKGEGPFGCLVQSFFFWKFIKIGGSNHFSWKFKSFAKLYKLQNCSQCIFCTLHCISAYFVWYGGFYKNEIQDMRNGSLRNRWKTHVRKCTGSEPVSSKLEEVTDHPNIKWSQLHHRIIWILLKTRALYVMMHPAIKPLLHFHSHLKDCLKGC